MIAQAAAHTLAAACGRSVLAIQDTSEVNFSGRAAKRIGLGPGGDGVSPGLFRHPLLLVDGEHEAVLWITATSIWTRPAEPAGNRKKRPIDDKESNRWLEATEAGRAAALASRPPHAR